MSEREVKRQLEQARTNAIFIVKAKIALEIGEKNWMEVEYWKKILIMAKGVLIQDLLEFGTVVFADKKCRNPMDYMDK